MSGRRKRKAPREEPPAPEPETKKPVDDRPWPYVLDDALGQGTSLSWQAVEKLLDEGRISVVTKTWDGHAPKKDANPLTQLSDTLKTDFLLVIDNDPKKHVRMRSPLATHVRHFMGNYPCGNYVVQYPQNKYAAKSPQESSFAFLVTTEEACCEAEAQRDGHNQRLEDFARFMNEKLRPWIAKQLYNSPQFARFRDALESDNADTIRMMREMAGEAPAEQVEAKVQEYLWRTYLKQWAFITTNKDEQKTPVMNRGSITFRHRPFFVTTRKEEIQKHLHDTWPKPVMDALAVIEHELAEKKSVGVPVYSPLPLYYLTDGKPTPIPLEQSIVKFGAKVAFDFGLKIRLPTANAKGFAINFMTRLVLMAEQGSNVGRHNPVEDLEIPKSACSSVPYSGPAQAWDETPTTPPPASPQKKPRLTEGVAIGPPPEEVAAPPRGKVTERIMGESVTLTPTQELPADSDEDDGRDEEGADMG